ncbi:MAG: DHH family phosphoesterase [Planctomycetota bacterium]|nr:DHH family phosphoesterase [Planctomycetota bacterium]
MTTPDVDPESAPAIDDHWSTTIDATEIVARLRDAKSVALTTHARPDGDAIGSTLALARSLQSGGKQAVPVYSGPWPRRFDPIVGRSKTLRVGALHGPPDLGFEPDLIVIADTGSWSQLSEVRAWIEPRREKCIVIDHHLHGDVEVSDNRLIERRAAAACEIMAPVCLGVLGLVEARDLPTSIAAPLYVGLATDTGWFRHSNVTPHVLRLASDLLETGIDHSALYQIVEQSDGPERIRLIGRAIASLELHADGRAALMIIRKSDLSECGAGTDDVGGLSDFAMTIGSVRVAAVLVELEPDLTKVSLRSKSRTSDDEIFIDVNQVARGLGGGGHAQAAGVRSNGPAEQARETILSALQAALG